MIASMLIRTNLLLLLSIAIINTNWKLSFLPLSPTFSTETGKARYLSQEHGSKSNLLPPLARLTVHLLVAR